MKKAIIVGATSGIGKGLAKFLPDEILEYKFLDTQLNELCANERHITHIFRYFSFIAVFIACLGLLGLASFSAEQRTKAGSAKCSVLQ